MKRTITFAIMALIALTSQAQLKVQRKNLIQIKNKLYLRENGFDFEVDTTTITVKLKEGKTLNSKGEAVIRENKLGYIDVTVPEGRKVEEYAKELDESGIFEIVELNTYGELCTMMTNDPYSSSLWHLDSTNVRQAWDYEMGKPNIKVAIIDTGIDKNHPDIGFGNNGYKNFDETLGWDYMHDITYSTPSHYHGTFVAGVVGAKTNNGVGIAGVAGGNGGPGVTMSSYRVGYGPYIDGSVIDDAIMMAVDNGAKVINMSFHIASNTSMNEAIEYAYSNGVNLVAASGNQSNNSINYPASHSMVIAVGAIDNTNHRSDFSNFGTGLDIVAPGKDIYSTYLNNGYVTSSGTSFSTPQVVGAVALMLSTNPNLTPLEVKNIIVATAQKLNDYTFDSNNWNNEVGYGIIDANACVRLASMKIFGFETICDSVSYHVSLLPMGYSVIWSLNNCWGISQESMCTNYPQSNECTLFRPVNQYFGSAQLNADIYDSYGNFVRTIKKTIRLRPKASYHLEYDFSGPFIGDIGFVTEISSARVPQNTIIKMRSTDFMTMTITPYGNITYFSHELDSVKFSCYGNAYLHCVSVFGCPEFNLEFIGVNGSEFEPYDPIINSNSGELKIALNPIAENSITENKSQTTMPEDGMEWDLTVHRYKDGKQMFSQTINGENIIVNTKGWEKGLYIVNIVLKGKKYTKMVKV